jgi:hypothetical protein
MPTNNLVKQRQYHTIQFTTATAGAIKTVRIQYEGAGQQPELTGTRLIYVAGLGAGEYAPTFGSQAAYTITNAVNVPALTDVSLMLGDIKSSGAGCGGIQIATQDANGNTIDQGDILYTGPSAACNTALTAEQIATDAVGADELAGVSRLEFGTCLVNPDKVKDNKELRVCTACSLEPGFESVIAWPPADYQRGMVAKGSSVHCVKTDDCHIDVLVLNESSWGRNSFDGPEQPWAYIAFTSPIRKP